MFNIVIVGVEVPELLQFVLKCPQGIEVFSPRAAGLDVSILKERVNAGSTTIFELVVRDVELFLGELAGLREEGFPISTEKFYTVDDLAHTQRNPLLCISGVFRGLQS